jgi:uncharacterized protein
MSDEQLFSEGVEIFKRHSDKEWSLTDCISFATMKRLKINTAFTFDVHFRQAGFNTIP